MVLSLPLIVWNRPPLHDVTLIVPSISGEYVVTAAASGELVIWKLTPAAAAAAAVGGGGGGGGLSLSVSPHAMLTVPGGAPVVAMVCGIIEWGKEVVLSVEADGSCCLWAITDGLCLINRRRLLPPCSAGCVAVSFATRSYAALAGSGMWLIALHLPTLSLVHTMNGHSEWLCGMLDFSWEVTHMTGRAARSPKSSAKAAKGGKGGGGRAARPSRKTLTVGRASGEIESSEHAKRRKPKRGDAASSSSGTTTFVPSTMSQKVMGLLSLTRDDRFYRWRLDEKRKICVATKIARLAWSGPSVSTIPPPPPRASPSSTDDDGVESKEASAAQAATKRWEWKDWQDPDEVEAVAAAAQAAAEEDPTTAWQRAVPSAAQRGFRTLAMSPRARRVVVVGGSRWGLMEGAEMAALRAPVEWSADGYAEGVRPTLVPQRQSGPPPPLDTSVEVEGGGDDGAATTSSSSSFSAFAKRFAMTPELKWLGAEWRDELTVVLWDSAGRAFAFDVGPEPGTASVDAGAAARADAGAAAAVSPTASKMRQRAASGADSVMRLIRSEIVGDRKHPPIVGRQYRAVFVGNEAIDLLLEKAVVSSRSGAVTMMKELFTAGAFTHSHNEHSFEDKHLFYRCTENWAAAAAAAATPGAGAEAEAGARAAVEGGGERTSELINWGANGPDAPSSGTGKLESGIVLLCRLDPRDAVVGRSRSRSRSRSLDPAVAPFCLVRCPLPAALRGESGERPSVPLIVGANCAGNGVSAWLWHHESASAEAALALTDGACFATTTADINSGWPQLHASAPATAGTATATRRSATSEHDIVCAASLLISSGAAQPWTSRDTLLIARAHTIVHGAGGERGEATATCGLTIVQMPLQPTPMDVQLMSPLCSSSSGPRRGDTNAVELTCMAFLPQRGETRVSNAHGSIDRRTRCHLVTGDSAGVVRVWELNVPCASTVDEIRRAAMSMAVEEAKVAEASGGVSGETLAAADPAGTAATVASVLAFRAATASAELVCEFHNHVSAVASISIAPADTPALFASIGSDETVIVYNYSPPSLRVAALAAARAALEAATTGPTLPARRGDIEAVAQKNLNNVWRPRQSKRDGRTYFVNITTRVTAWTLPIDAIIQEKGGKAAVKVEKVKAKMKSSSTSTSATTTPRTPVQSKGKSQATGESSMRRPSRKAPSAVLSVDASAELVESAQGNDVPSVTTRAEVRAAMDAQQDTAAISVDKMEVSVQCALRGHSSSISAVMWQQWRAGVVIVTCASGESVAWNLVSGVRERRVPTAALWSAGMAFDGADILDLADAVGDGVDGGGRGGEEPADGFVGQHSQDVALVQQRERSAIAAPRECLAPSFGAASGGGGWRSSAPSRSNASTATRHCASSYERPRATTYAIPSLTSPIASGRAGTPTEGADVAVAGGIAGNAARARGICFSDVADDEADESRDVIDVQSGRAACLRLHVGALANQLKMRHNTGAVELGYLLAWGLEPEIDSMCEEHLRLCAPKEIAPPSEAEAEAGGEEGSDGSAASTRRVSSVLSFGLVGAGGALSLCPPSAASGSRRWAYSERLTALHSLALVSLFMALMASKKKSGAEPSERSRAYSKLITHYAVMFPEGMRQQRKYIEPELPFFARLALAVWEEGHVAARLLMQCTVERMPRESRVAAAYMWAARMQVITEKVEAKARAAAAMQRVSGGDGGGGGSAKNSPVIAGSSGSAAASAKSKKRAAAARRAKGRQRAVSPRRVRRGADNAEMPPSELEVMVVVLSVIGVANHTDLSPATARPIARVLMNFLRVGSPERAAFAADMLGKGFVLWRPYLDGSLQGLVRTLLRRALQSGPPEKGEEVSLRNPSVATAAQRALMELGSAEPGQFLQTCGREALRAGAGPRYHCTALMALVALVSKRPAALLRFLPDVVTAVIRTLDPSEPEQRKGCLRASTRALHELVKQYPMVSFHQESQRYAVGTLSSVIVIFDLRTATKWRMLEGHKKALTAVAFVASGDMVASYSAEEKALKLWRSGSKGFMSQMLSVTSRCQNTIALRPIRDVEKITAEKMLKTVKLNWISPRVVHLIREDGSSVTEQLK